MAREVKQASERRQEIIEAARHLFEEQDYENTTIKDVMEYVGIAKGTIYHHFKSKEDLLEAVIESMVTEYIEQMQHLVDEMEGSAIEKFRMLAQAGSVDEEHESVVKHMHQPGNVGMHTRLLASTIKQLAPLYAEVIREGCEEGVFQTEHPLEAAEFILSAVQFLTDIGFYPWEDEDLMRRATAIPGLVEAQLNAPAGSFSFLVDQL